MSSNGITAEALRRVLEDKLFFYRENLEGWGAISNAKFSYQTFDDEKLLGRTSKTILSSMQQPIHIVELGIGDLRKLKVVLNAALHERIEVASVRLVDISQRVFMLAGELERQFPYLQGKVDGYPCDFTQDKGFLPDTGEDCYVISMGSSFLNAPDPRDKIDIIKSLIRPGDVWHVSQDASAIQSDTSAVLQSYGQAEYEAFLKKPIRKIPGFVEEDWTFGHELGPHDPREESRYHVFSLTPKSDPSDKVAFFVSWKHESSKIKRGCDEAGLSVQTEMLPNAETRMIHYVITAKSDEENGENDHDQESLEASEASRGVVSQSKIDAWHDGPNGVSSGIVV